jgi:hypothetical protein
LVYTGRSGRDLRDLQAQAGPSPHKEKSHMDDTFPDLGSLSDVELKEVIRQLTDEETEISYRRRILHGKIDILRAELVNRLRHQHEGGDMAITGDDVQKLTDILTNHQPDSTV